MMFRRQNREAVRIVSLPLLGELADAAQQVSE
jgi:hypothetical protein